MDEETQAILINVIEESAEVIHAATKCLRFGLHKFDPDDLNEVPNHQALAREIGNLKHLTTMATERGIISGKHICQGVSRKQSNLDTYRLINREQSS